MISSSFWFTLFETLLYIHYHIRVILVLLWLHIYTHLKLQNNHLLHSNSSFFIVFTHIYTHIHILYTKSHIQSRYQDLQQTNFPFPLSTIMDRLPATHIIYLSILIFLETVQKVLSSNLLCFYSCLFYLLIDQHALIRN